MTDRERLDDDLRVAQETLRAGGILGSAAAVQTARDLLTLRSTSPCGHWSDLAHTKDRGKTIRCYACQVARLTSELDRESGGEWTEADVDADRWRTQQGLSAAVLDGIISEHRRLREHAEHFIRYYTHRGGCSNCGGVPHSTECFVGRVLAALSGTAIGVV